MNEENHLLRDGETIEEWWARNGLNHETVRDRRQEEYIRQLKEAAVKMSNFKNQKEDENATRAN